MRKQIFRIFSTALTLALCTAGIELPQASAATDYATQATLTATAYTADAAVLQSVREEILAAWDAQETRLDITETISTDDFQTLLADTLRSEPSYFYVDTYYQLYETTSGNAAYILFTYLYEEADIPGMQTAYNAKVDEIIRSIPEDSSDLETALYLHDYIVSHAEYDTTYERYSAYDILIDGTAVCQGYALAYVQLMRSAGLECYFVSSEELNHGWNLVGIDDAYYYVDATWDDPTGDRFGMCQHDYFLLTEDELRAKEHDADDWLICGTDALDISVADSTRFQGDALAFRTSAFPVTPIDDTTWAILDADGTLNAVTYENGTTTDTRNVITTILDYWYVVDGVTGAYYPGVYGGCAAYQGTVYYGTPTKIYAITPDGSKQTLVYTLTAAEQATGYLYGFVIDTAGLLTYRVATTASDTGIRDTVQLEIVEPDYMLGDVTGDSMIDSDDAVAVLKANANELAGLESVLTVAQRLAADVNESGSIDAVDAMIMLQYFASYMLDDTVVISDFL